MNSISCRLFIPNTKGEPVRLLSALFLSFLASAYGGAAKAQISDNLVRIGVLGDLSGVYADFGGPGDVAATRMAVEDFGGRVLGKPIDVIAADHQSKADIGAAIARATRASCRYSPKNCRTAVGRDGPISDITPYHYGLMWKAPQGLTRATVRVANERVR